MMDIIPNEILRFILSHLSYLQRRSIIYVAKIWWYLIQTFSKIPSDYIHTTCPDSSDISYNFIKEIHSSDKMLIFGHNSINIVDKKFNQYIRSSSNIAINNERIIISDSTLHKIRIFDIEGKIIHEFGSYGRENGEFIDPQGVAIDYQTNDIIVVDSGNDRIQVFDMSGKFIFTFGSEHQFNNLSKVTINQENRDIIAVDFQNGYIFDYTGVHKSTFDQIFCPSAIVTNGNIIALIDLIDRIQIFDVFGNFIFKIFEEKTTAYLSGMSILKNDTIVCPSNRGLHFFIPFYK